MVCAQNGHTEEPNGSSTSPRRPATRSQTTATGTATRGDGQDSHSDEDQGEPSSSKHTLDEDPDEMEDEYHDMPSVGFNPATFSPPAPSQYTFLETYTSASQSERRGPRTRTAPPVPVPNLTKKSRGRRVPTKVAGDKESTQKEAPPKEGVQKGGRVYVCKVEDCGKCFSRGEHLKRHIRSIHTHEKRECWHCIELPQNSIFLLICQPSNVLIPLATSSSTDMTTCCSTKKCIRTALRPLP
jgi:hypothetical protein